MKDLHPEHAIEQLEQAAGTLDDGDLRRRCEKLAQMTRDLLESPAPRWVEDHLRLIDRYVFTRPIIESLPAEWAARDPERLYSLLWVLDCVQHSLRQELRRRFSLRPIIATEMEPYDEHSPRFAVNRTRATGNNALDWCVAQTVALGFEWDATPSVLRPARVDVYRYVDSAREPEVWSVSPPTVACGSKVEMTLRGTGLGEVRSAWVGGVAAAVTSSCDDLVTLEATVPLAPGPLEVETSSLQDAQVPALHRESFHGFAVAYEALRLDVETASDRSMAIRCHPPETIVSPRDSDATWTPRRDASEPGVWWLDILGSRGCLQGMAERSASVLSGSAEGIRDLEVRIEEAFVIVLPTGEASVPPVALTPPAPPEVAGAPPHDAPSQAAPPESPPPSTEPRDPAGLGEATSSHPCADEAPVTAPASPAAESVHVVLVGPGGERMPLSPLPPGSRVEIRVCPLLSEGHGDIPTSEAGHCSRGEGEVES